MSIRSRLILLVLSVLAPTLLFCLAVIYSVYSAQHAHIQRTMSEATRAVALAIDRDLARRDAIVSTLAHSPSLVRGDFPVFRSYLMSLLESDENVFVVGDEEGHQLLNTRVPEGEPLPENTAAATYPLHEGMNVSGLYMSRIGKQYSFAVTRPVYRDGELVYHISMGSFASQIDDVLAEQRLPEGWLGTVVDRDMTIVARSRSPEAYVGLKPSNYMKDVLHQSNRGSTESVTLDGTPVYSFFSRAPASGWTVILALPKAELRGSALRAVTAVSIGSLLLLGVSLILAFWVGRKITRPLDVLDDAAQAMGRGEPIEAPVTGLDETDRTGRVLAEASRRILNGNALMLERVAEAVRQAEQSQQAMLQGQKLEALGRLTGGIAHDFNNLLQTMTVGLQLAERMTVDPRAKMALEACSRSVQRGTKLTRQLMIFGRQRTQESQVIDLRELLLGMTDLLEGALPSRINLRVELPERPWLTCADPLQCELAILNMTFNARDAMPDGGEVRIGLDEVRLPAGNPHGLPAGSYISLTLRDNGQGMSEDVLAKAFEPFFTTKAVGAGTGLGLAQVYGFASQSGGTVVIHSQPGEGTEVRVLLPICQENEVAPQAAAPAAIEGRFDARVLLVDDNEQVRDVVASMLRELGCEVEEAADAAQALKRFDDPDKPAFDIVFSDIVMPGELDGIGLAQALRARSPELPILLATGYTERAPADYGFRVLAKPYDMHLLVEALQSEIRHDREGA